MTAKSVRVLEFVSADLALRESANRFFDNLESLPEPAITVDFRGVQSITRSFAHQYHLRKNASKKSIAEKNIPAHVERMLELVQTPAAKPRLVDLKTISITAL